MALLLLIAPQSLASGVCGDCDLDGVVNVVDSLTAAQIGAGSFPPTVCQQDNCDVDSSGTIDAIDALLIAQASAGLPVVLNCPGPPPVATPNPVIGYCVTGTMNSNDDFDMLVVDSDPTTTASFTFPVTAVPETQVVTVTNPGMGSGPPAIAAALITAVNSTAPFVDLVNPPGTGVANFIGAGPTPVMGVTCFTPFVASATPSPLHFASLGFVNNDGTVCFPGDPATPTCTFNPTFGVFDLAKDENKDGLPDEVVEWVESMQEDGEGSDEGSDGGSNNGDDGA